MDLPREDAEVSATNVRGFTQNSKARKVRGNIRRVHLEDECVSPCEKVFVTHRVDKGSDQRSPGSGDQCLQELCGRKA